MKRPFLNGFIVALFISAFLLYFYGNYREKIGWLTGRKEGTIAVINFLAKHFPESTNEPHEPGHTFGIKWYGINVVETNGINTLRVKNKM